jgi:hypothetical protein
VCGYATPVGKVGKNCSACKRDSNAPRGRFVGLIDTTIMKDFVIQHRLQSEEGANEEQDWRTKEDNMVYRHHHTMVGTVY